MAVVKQTSILSKTPWEFETSQEFSASGWVITGGEGELHFKHGGTGDMLKTRYDFMSVGSSKGAVVNIAESILSDPSGGLSCVKVFQSLTFGPSDIPCKGWFVQFGATAGIFQPSFISQSGISVAVVLFGAIPWGGVMVWGRFNSLLPSAGPSVGFANFNRM